MIKEILRLRTRNAFGGEAISFKGIVIEEYQFKSKRMGIPQIEATLMYDDCLDNEWTGREYVTFRGETYILKHTPSSSKSNSDMRYRHELIFTPESAEIMANTYFYDAVYEYSLTKDKPCSNSTVFTFFGTLREAVDRLNCSFKYAGIGDSILGSKTTLTADDAVAHDGFCAMIDENGDFDETVVKEITLQDQSLWEAIEQIYKAFEVPFEIRGKRIIFGAVPTLISHKFKYGHNDALLSIEKKNANAKVINRITMLGSSENIPYYYPNESEYGHIAVEADPDNRVLTTEAIEVKRISQLLANVREGEYAVLAKYPESYMDVTFPTATAYWVGTGDSNLVAYKLGTDRKYSSNRSADTTPLRFGVYFTVKEKGRYSCRQIYGMTWRRNTARPDATYNILDTDMQVDIFSKRTGVGVYTEMVGKTYKDSVGIGFGDLDAGDYYFQIHVDVINRDRDNIPVDTYYRFTGIDIGMSPSVPKGYYWKVGDKNINEIGKLGIALSIKPSDDMLGDKFKWSSSARMPFQTYLMPPKYRETNGEERFYNAENDKYINPDTNQPYVFPNPYVEGHPIEHIYKNEDIKPTIEGIRNAEIDQDTGLGQLFGSIAAIAYDSGDNDSLKAESDEENDKHNSLKYEHSYFYIKLNIFNGQYGFDLFNHASQVDAMTLQITSGPCNGCKFKVQAVEFTDDSGVKSYKNPVRVLSPNGDIVSGGYSDKVKKDGFQDFQQDTSKNSIWICVQKDAETFGVIMPNREHSYAPQVGDTFNIINIDLPDEYIYAAEKRLEEEGLRYMADNNEEKFTFDISASRIFFAENPDVLSLLDEYSKIIIVYNNKEYELYITSFEVNCTANDALPEIRIEVSDELAIGESFSQRVVESALSLIANPTTLGGNTNSGGVSIAALDRRYINKIGPDITPYKLTSELGFEVGNYVSGTSGGVFYRNPETGKVMIETDELRVRMKAIFEALEIAKVKSIGGKLIITPGGSVDISFVEETSTCYRCFFKVKDEDKGANCRFIKGDMVQCREFNVTSGTAQTASNTYYWRKVVSVNNDECYVDLSKTDYDKTSDNAPHIGDTICQLGNESDETRQSAIILSTVDDAAPCVTLFSGINDYSLENKAVVEYGVDKTVSPPEPFFNCYGRFYYGPRDKSSYLEFNPSVGELEYKGTLNIKSTIGNKAIPDYLSESIGGVNLLRKTTKMNDSKLWLQTIRVYSDTAEEWQGVTTYQMSQSQSPVQAFFECIAGAKYIFSAWVKVEGTTLPTSARIATFNASTGNLQFPAERQTVDISDQLRTEEWCRVKGVFTAPDSGELCIGLWFNHSDSAIRIGGFKLERGEVATDWSRNPSDNDTSGFDYLREALEQDTSITGGLVQTSVVIQGRKESDGTYTVWSGSNGLYVSGDTPAFWAGGEMADYFNSTSTSTRPATYMIRMDGTGYAAGGTIRFLKNEVMLGDYVHVTTDGFSITDGSTPAKEIIRLSNTEIGTINDISKPQASNIKLSANTINTKVNYGREGFGLEFESGETRYKLARIYVKNDKSTLTLPLQFVVNLNNIDFNIPDNGPLTIYSYPNMFVEIVRESDGVVVYSASESVRPSAHGSNVNIFFDIYTRIDLSGSYSINIYFDRHTTANPTTASSTLYKAATMANVYTHTGRQTLLGNNGFATAWGDTLIFANEEQVCLRAGKFTLRLHKDQGFGYNTDGTEVFKPLGWE